MKLKLLAVLATVALGGCANQTFSIRRLPAQTPAADNAAAVALADSDAYRQGASLAGEATAPPLQAADAPPLNTYDPWARMNRFTYRCNARFDEAVLLPAANAYRRLPPPVRTGVHNFFSNLAEPASTINGVLQLRPRSALISAGRFLINSSVGVAGLFDVATKLQLASAATGFGATLSRWGLHPGPYLVLPLLGPSTLRDSIGLAGDYGLAHTINLANLYRGVQGWSLGVVYGVEQRANIDFRYYASGSPFEYEIVRFLYVHRELIEDEAQRKRPRQSR